jgi:hypothetical protein
MISGYNVFYIDSEDGVKDILWKKRYIWKTWNDAINSIYELINKMVNDNFHYDLAYISEIECEPTGQIACTFYNDQNKNEETGYVIIYPLFQTQ